MKATSTLLPLPTKNVLIPAAEISHYTGMAKQTHARWRHEGTGPPYIKLGRRVFYRSDDVKAWEESNYQSTLQQVQELNQSDTQLDVSNV